MQFLYCFVVGSFPFNSFLSGFFCSLGLFVLMGKQCCHLLYTLPFTDPGSIPEDFIFIFTFTGCNGSELLQSLTVLQGIMALPGKAFCEACLLCAVSLRMQVDPTSTEFKSLLLERAYADAIFCGCLLFLIVWNFMG